MTKKLLFIILFLPVCLSAQNKVTTTIDERVELLSTVFHISSAMEFTSYINLPYNKIVDNWFYQYRHHKIVAYTQHLRVSRAVGYSAVASLAVRLKIEKGKISLNSDWQNGLDERWDTDSISEYISLLNDFYKKTKFNKFFKANAEYYNKVVQDVNAFTSNQIDINRFVNFFGVGSNYQFNIVIGLLNGPNNYGANIKNSDGQEYIYAIIGCGAANKKSGLPI